MPLLSEQACALVWFRFRFVSSFPTPGIFRMIVKLKMLRELAFWKYNEGKDLAFLEHLENE